MRGISIAKPTVQVTVSQTATNMASLAQSCPCRGKIIRGINRQLLLLLSDLSSRKPVSPHILHCVISSHIVHSSRSFTSGYLDTFPIYHLAAL